MDTDATLGITIRVPPATEIINAMYSIKAKDNRTLQTDDEESVYRSKLQF